MITKSLKEFASPIISKAMASGARSSSTTTTNYGGIGDAMFKKAQLDMNMADLTYKMKSDNINLRANNSLRILDIQQAVNDRHAARVAESQDMGDMEKAMGTLTGAVTGAVTGFAAGGPTGAVVGGVAGGAVAADTYYGDSVGAEQKRMTGARNQQMMGTVANMSTSLRSMYDQQKGRESFGKTSKNLANIAQAIQSMGPGAERDAKIAEYNTKTAASSAELSKYYGPQEVNTMMEGLRKGAPAVFSNDPATRDKALLAQNGIAAAADPLLQSSSPEGRNRLRQYHADNNAILGRLYGSDKEHNMSNAEFSQWAGAVNPQLGAEATSMYNGGISSVRQAPPSTGGGMAPSANQVSQPRMAPPQQGRSVPQAPVISQAPSSNVDNSQSYMLNHPGVGGGVVMDDGMSFLSNPIGSIQKMNEQGVAAAEVFKPKEEPGMMERGARKVGEMLPGKDNFEEFADRKAAGRETHQPENRQDGKVSPEMEARNLAEVKVKSAEIDKQINDNLEQAKASQTMSIDGLAKAEQIRNAQDGLNKMEKLVGKVPNNSQLKAMASQVYLEGLKLGKTGQALGATIGLSGGIAGVLAGNVVGDTMGNVLDGQAVGKGSQKLVSAILSKDEIAAINEYARVSSLAVPAMVKTADGNMVTNPEAEAMKANFFNYGMSKDQQLQAIVTLKENLATKAGSISEFSRAGKAQFDYKTKMPIDYRARAQQNKAYDEAYRRESGRRDRASQDAENEDVPFFDGGYIPLN